jgi:osmotically inducible lipoprotein OsmB
MKKFLVVPVLALALAGCQSAGPNQTIGTGVGAVGGYAAARALGAGSRGSAVGAVAGALIGNEVGRNMDQPQQAQPYPPRPVVVQERYVPVPPRRPHCYSTWERTYNGMIERRICQ